MRNPIAACLRIIGVFLHFFFLGQAVQAQIITSIAGNGINGYGGDGGPATTAITQFFLPSAVNMDAAGNLYIADSYNHRIRKIDAAGIITTVAGNGLRAGLLIGSYSGDGGAATLAGLSAPHWAITDNAGNLYISDQENNRVRKVDAGGIITTIAGNGTTIYTGDGPATMTGLRPASGGRAEAMSMRRSGMTVRRLWRVSRRRARQAGASRS